ncbi:MAG: class I SAM-dependent methyltransferase [Nitrosomonas sp.]|nr:class I SAM-dependent methyltransferase [Nitrosomonas sp.]MBY0579306.1 class I SAM-dependent methyltransferase [Burkholderiales bacterium]
MENINNLYDRYTSTSSLVPGVDEASVLTWSKRYFRSTYAEFLPGDKNSKILEVGCGYGRYLKALSEMGYANFHGIDLSSEQIAYAKSVLQLSQVEQADALEWLSDKEGMFDCILGLDILEHFQTDDLLVLGEKIYRALKPGGTVIFQVPNGMSPINPFLYGDLTHVRAFTPQSMQQFLLHVGLSPSGYFEIPPDGKLRRILWRSIVKPCLGFLVRVTHGKMMGGHIYTSNFATIAKKVKPSAEL